MVVSFSMVILVVVTILIMMLIFLTFFMAGFAPTVIVVSPDKASRKQCRECAQ